MIADKEGKDVVESLVSEAEKANPTVDLNAVKTYNKPDSILDVIINSFHFTLKAAAKYQTEDADLLITPDLSKFNMVSTDQIKDLIEQGYKDAKEQLKKADCWFDFFLYVDIWIHIFR